MSNIQKVVGIAFIKDKKLLIVQSKKSSKTNSYTFIGGGVEEGETIIDAAVREVSEEIHNGFTIEPTELELVMTKQEKAASDPNKTIEMNMFIAKKEINVKLVPNEEILIYHWYSLDEDLNVSNSIKDFIDYAKKNNIL
ncbi:MAG: NUDIX domain-containing protein [Firmicutes bacterium]|nr:NUDIX domain-containing protein [Bacillota bacterium]